MQRIIERAGRTETASDSKFKKTLELRGVDLFLSRSCKRTLSKTIVKLVKIIFGRFPVESPAAEEVEIGLGS